MKNRLSGILLMGFVFFMVLILERYSYTQVIDQQVSHGVYEVSGWVESSSDEAITLRSGAQLYVFSKDQLEKRPLDSLSQGSKVKVRFSLRVREVINDQNAMDPSSMQLPILDDRAFSLS